MLRLYSPLEVTVCVSVDFYVLEKLQPMQRWMDGANVQYAAERITYTVHIHLSTGSRCKYIQIIGRARQIILYLSRAAQASGGLVELLLQCVCVCVCVCVQNPNELSCFL